MASKQEKSVDLDAMIEEIMGERPVVVKGNPATGEDAAAVLRRIDEAIRRAPEKKP